VILPVTRFILVRHGESEGNRDKRFPNHLAPLTELGRSQAQTAAEWIARRYNPHLVVVSPFVRTHQTGAIIAAHLGVELAVEPDIREQHMGLMMGQPWETARKDPTWDRIRFWLWRPAGGENYEDVRARAGGALDRMAQVHRGHEVVIVSHGGVISALWAHAAGSWKGVRVPRNCGIVITEHAEGRYLPPVIPE
jgi:broad specificity phosphatase PhoE